VSTRTSGRYVLDTNVAIAVLNGEDAATRYWKAAETVLLPAPVLGELLYGARRSVRPSENEARAIAFARTMGLILVDETVCQNYGAVKASTHAAGRPIPDNDIWVAACCFAAEAILVSRDSHFDSVDGLVREEWR
jgi:tRNA(fMet)-specific endonuclease VapC